MKLLLVVSLFVMACINTMPGKVINVNESNFKTEVTLSERVVVADFSATWCGSCQHLDPIINDFAKNNPQYKVVKIDADESYSLILKYKIALLPTLIVFNNGKEIKRSVGFISKEQLDKFVK